MIERKWAEHFAAEWIAMWNNHDLEAILTHYADNIVFHSPRIAMVMGEKIDFIAGKASARPLLGQGARQRQGSALRSRSRLRRQRQPDDRLSQSPRPARDRDVCVQRRRFSRRKYRDLCVVRRRLSAQQKFVMVRQAKRDPAMTILLKFALLAQVISQRQRDAMLKRLVRKPLRAFKISARFPSNSNASSYSSRNVATKVV